MYTAFTYPGDCIYALPIVRGEHISTGERELGGTADAMRGLNVQSLALDEKELNFDVDETIKRVESLMRRRGVKPKLVMFGASIFLFPHPVRELGGYFHSLGAIVAYDAAHVAGLIAGGVFQDPLREVADVIFLSTHKTLPGLQHGMFFLGEVC